MSRFNFNFQLLYLLKLIHFMNIIFSILKLFKNEPKGELTIVVSEKQINKNTSQKISESDKNSIKIMLHKLSTKEITNIISQYSNVSKKEIYEYCVKLKNEK